MRSTKRCGTAAEGRFIHGRSGGRLRGALHTLGEALAVCGFRLNQRNAGVTIISL